MNIEKIYKDYGFEIKDEDDEIKTFLYKKGRYFGVDIIQPSKHINKKFPKCCKK